MSTRYLASLALVVLTACGGGSPTPNTGGSGSGGGGGAASSDPGRWEEVYSLEGSDAAMSIAGERVWIVQDAKVLALDGGKGPAKTRFTGDKERFRAVCESNGHVYAAGITPKGGVLVHGTASAGDVGKSMDVAVRLLLR